MFSTDGHVRIQRVRLEHHRDVAVLRRHHRDVAVADEHVAGVDRLEAGEHPQRRRLAAARWADQHEELAVFDLEVERVHGGTIEAVVHPGCSCEGDSCHQALLTEWW